MQNASLVFPCRIVTLEVASTANPFTGGYTRKQTLRVPVAHGDGNYFAAPEVLDRLEQEDRIAFRYADGSNPNGSARDIAGILNEGRNVLGLMPHPENVVGLASGGSDGKALFAGMAHA